MGVGGIEVARIDTYVASCVYRCLHMYAQLQEIQTAYVRTVCSPRRERSSRDFSIQVLYESFSDIDR